jgi:hypothetical protein
MKVKNLVDSGKLKRKIELENMKLRWLSSAPNSFLQYFHRLFPHPTQAKE